MASPVENFSEPDMAVIPGNLHPQPKRGHDDDSGVIGNEKRWPGWPGESVFRLIVPAQKVGGIIGRKGEFIKRMCEETRARIKIFDGPPGTSERTGQCKGPKINVGSSLRTLGFGTVAPNNKKKPRKGKKQQLTDLL